MTEYWLATRDGSSVRLVDGGHSSPDGVVKAQKLMRRIFRDDEQYVMAAVSPVPEIDVEINEQAADDCAALVDWARAAAVPEKGKEQ